MKPVGNCCKVRLATGPAKPWNFGRPLSRPRKSRKIARSWKVLVTDDNVVEFLQPKPELQELVQNSE